MGYRFVIGKPTIDGTDPDTIPAHEDVDDPPHADEYEMTPYRGVAVRLPSYTAWSGTLEKLPLLNECWEALRAYGYHVWIPIDDYDNRLPGIYKEAKTLLDGEPRIEKDDFPDKWSYFTHEIDFFEEHGSENAAAALRALWFARWSQTASRLYRDKAVFEKPLEWK